MPKSKSTRSTSHELAKAGDPLVLADGSEFGPELAEGEEDAQPAQGLNARTFKATKKRTLKDLPSKPQMINAVACTFMYTTLGVGDREIAIALNISAAELTAIRKHPAYQECFEAVLDQFISVNSSLLQARIAAYGEKAVENIFQIAGSAKKEELRFSANKDIADRAGITAKQHQSNRLVLNDLHITISKGQETDEVRVSIGSDDDEALDLDHDSM